jgi:dTDP-4-dehydrorhamnose 3,5-epimerase
MSVLEARPLGLAGLIEIRVPRMGDERGFFSETWNRDAWASAGIDVEFVQDNHSLSARPGVLRGLHYQLEPMAQDKLVRVVRGAIFDVAVDVRRSSPTFGHWAGLTLSAREWNQLLVPKGFAHGFVTLEPDTEVLYKVSAPYSPGHDRAVRYDDPAIGIAWPEVGPNFQLSAKDSAAPLLAQAEVFA